MNMKLQCVELGLTIPCLCCQLVPVTAHSLFSLLSRQHICLSGDLLALAVSIPPYESNSRTSELLAIHLEFAAIITQSNQNNQNLHKMSKQEWQHG